jgi:hypothetical protein
MNRDTVIQVIKDLANKTIENGCTEAEVMAAMDKINLLLKTYNLSMDKVFIEQSACVQELIDSGNKKRDFIDIVLTGIKVLTDCIVWRDTNYRTVVYRIFGMEPDVKMAKYLYFLIKASGEAEYNKYKANTRNNFVHGNAMRKSFFVGFTNRMYSRLLHLAKDRKAEVAQKQSTQIQGSLIVMKQNKVADEFAKVGIKLKKSKATYFRIKDRTAYDSGANAADSVNLNRPIGGGKQLLLT